MRVMFAIDGSACSWHALEEAIRTLPLQGAEAHVVAVAPIVSAIEDPMAYGMTYQATWREHEDVARGHLKEAERLLVAAGLTPTLHLRVGEPVDELVAVAQAVMPDVVVVGSHGRTAFGRFMLGSVSDALVHRWPGPVMVIRRPEDGVSAPAGRKVASVMTPDPICVRADQPVAIAARMMREGDTGFLPVVDAGTLAGVITDRDLALRVVGERLDPDATLVGEVCSHDVAFAAPGMPVEEAVRLMERRRVRRLVVLDGRRILGVVSLGDLAETLPHTAEHCLVEISKSTRTLAHEPPPA